MRRVNLTGCRYGRLVALRPTDGRAGSSVIWECRCDCGNTALVSAASLRRGLTRSCGCLSREQRRANLSGDLDAKIGRVDGTVASRIVSKRPQSNTSSGHKGVSLHHQTGRKDKWIAYIYFQGHRYGLGSYDTFGEAVKAREDAEKRLFDGFLAWHGRGHGIVDAKPASIPRR